MSGCFSRVLITGGGILLFVTAPWQIALAVFLILFGLAIIIDDYRDACTAQRDSEKGERKR